MFTEALFVIAPNWKHLNCPSAGKWINRPWRIHKMDYYSAIKKNEPLLHIMTWINLKIIMQSERSQPKQSTYYMIKLWKIRN